MLDFPDPPTSTDALRSFPKRTLTAGTKLFRIHHADLGPCWFSSAQVDDAHGGRFDLADPDGTSYWALRPEAAFLETIARRPITVIPAELLDRSHLSTIRLPKPIEAANSPVQRSRAFGLTGEFHTTPDSGRTRPWAAALHDAGHEALIAIPRHDVTGRQRSVAMFGQAGEHVPTGWKACLETEPIPSRLIDAMSAWGIRSIPIPFDVDTVRPPT